MDQLNPSSSSSRADRKTIERNRRNHMKELYSQLNSLVPHQTTKEVSSLPDQLDEAAIYIKKLQVSLERMKEKKKRLMGFEKNPNSIASSSRSSSRPSVEIHEMGSALEVVLITALDCQFMFNETIRILHQEEAEIVHASFSAVNDDTILHTIHCKIGEVGPNLRAARLSMRLKNFVEANIGG